jgi:catalase
LDQKNDGPQNIGTKEFFEMEKKIQDLENQLKQNCGAINESEELKKWKEAYAQLDQSKTEMMEFKDNAIESLKKELKQEAENYIRVLTKEKDDVIENLKIQLTDMTEEKDRFLKRAKFLEDKYEPEKI